MKFISFITITFIGLVQTTSGLTKDVSKIIGDPSELLDCDSIEKEGARLSCLRADIGKLYNLVEALEYIEDLNQATPNDIQKDQAILVQEEGVYYYSVLGVVWLVMKTMCCYCCSQYFFASLPSKQNKNTSRIRNLWMSFKVFLINLKLWKRIATSQR